MLFYWLTLSHNQPTCLSHILKNLSTTITILPLFVKKMTQQQSSSSLTFPSPASLSDFLSGHLPSLSLSSWGTSPGTKTLHNLYIELSNGESALSHPPLLRTVSVAVLHLRNARGATLIESRQLLSDGRIRHRNRPLSEKMVPGESIEVAARRAIREELGEKVKARLVMESHTVEIDESKASGSYPGLDSRYVVHNLDAVLEEGVPEEGEFETEEHGEEKDEREGTAAVFVRKHFWKWE